METYDASILVHGDVLHVQSTRFDAVTSAEGRELKRSWSDIRNGCVGCCGDESWVEGDENGAGRPLWKSVRDRRRCRPQGGECHEIRRLSDRY